MKYFSTRVNDYIICDNYYRYICLELTLNTLFKNLTSI